MLGVLWGRAELLEKLKPYRVETNKDVLPGKFEMGMLNNTSLGRPRSGPGISARTGRPRFRTSLRGGGQGLPVPLDHDRHSRV